MEDNNGSAGVSFVSWGYGEAPKPQLRTFVEKHPRIRAIQFEDSADCFHAISEMCNGVSATICVNYNNPAKPFLSEPIRMDVGDYMFKLATGICVLSKEEFERRYEPV